MTNDVVVVLVTTLFFAFAVGYVAICERVAVRR